MSNINITYCDICKEPFEPQFVSRNSLLYIEREITYAGVGKKIFDEKMDICINCFKKHILPLREINNV